MTQSDHCGPCPRPIQRAQKGGKQTFARRRRFGENRFCALFASQVFRASHSPCRHLRLGSNVGLHTPARALSLTLAGIGSGFEGDRLQGFRNQCRAQASEFERQGSIAIAQLVGMGPGRISFLLKDPRGFRDFYDALGQHDAQGSAKTMRGFVGARPPLSEYEDAFRRVTLPTLILLGDEDDSCVEASLFLKKHIATSGLAMFPKTGHVLNLEEPSLFNEALERFLAAAEARRWPARDPRSIRV